MNQIVETVHSLLAVLKSAAHTNPAFMTTAEKAEALVGLAEGLFTLEHVRMIVRALDELPDEVPTEVVAKAEAQLCAWAGEFTPCELGRLARQVVAVVAPEVGEEADARAIQRLEAQSTAKATLSITPQGDGMTRVHGLVPDAVGVRLRTVLEAYAQPRVTALEADGKIRPRSRLMAEALGQLLETVDADALPAHGGDATTVIVTVPLTQLRAELGMAELGDAAISAAEARRLACTAAIIPAVLGGKSEILDLGRTRRLFSTPQRKALRIRDRRCRAEGCAVPAPWCDAHHAKKPWSHGGRTDLADGVLLCGHHHRRAHDPAYETTRLASGDFRFHRRR